MSDVKITALPARSAVATTDIFPVVDAAAGTPATQKATVAQVRATIMPVVLTADVTGALPVANQAVAGTTPQFIWNNGTAYTGSAGFTYDLATTQARTAPNCGILFRNIANTFDGRFFWNVSAAQTIVLPDATGTVVLADNVATLTNKTISGASNTLTVRLTAAADVTGVLPAANQAAQTMAGDVTGTTAAAVVAKINGATVPAAGALTTGNLLQVTGLSATGYAALNLAGGANFVTGLLPAGNQASQTMAGDVTGTTAASVVAKINGATVPAAGALTTGHVLQVSGVSADTYGFIADANVSATAAIAGTKINPNFGSQAITSTSGASFGSTPALTGTLSLSSAATVMFRTNGNTGDIQALSKTAADDLLIGSRSSTTQGHVFVEIPTGQVLRVQSQVANNWIIEANNTNVLIGMPILGHPSQPSPYSVHGRAPLHALGTNTTYTVTAAEYSFQVLQFSSTTSTLCTVTLPDPATEAGSYFKDVDVGQCNVSQGVKFTAGAGTRTAQITGGGLAVTSAPKRIFVSPGCVDLAPG